MSLFFFINICSMEDSTFSSLNSTNDKKPVDLTCEQDILLNHSSLSLDNFEQMEIDPESFSDLPAFFQGYDHLTPVVSVTKIAEGLGDFV